ncbi:MAG: hypothetical protein K8S13_22810 [Desulfobacula sp.]|uniref:hypothetical protein n=1 Tax=Desulfobacula sp. TaxID=2593537 RepID=UPI0025BEE789|nr:hypothetical protein [Desulfobacula sp.]MCD4722661.1 hypothetical protein [Desulfobacula sp.]
MIQDIKTLELAKIYESQGYYEDALEIYSFLNNRETTNEISAGLKRMEKRMEDEGPGSHPEEKIFGLFEKWLMLMVLQQRLDNFKKIKLRLL